MPAHRATLASLAIDYGRSSPLSFRCAELIGQGRARHRNGARARRSCRGLTPSTKLATARWAVAEPRRRWNRSAALVTARTPGSRPSFATHTSSRSGKERRTSCHSTSFAPRQRSDALTALLNDAAEIVSQVASVTVVERTANEVLAAIGTLKQRIETFVSDDVTAQAAARSIALSVANVYAVLCFAHKEHGLQRAAANRQRVSHIDSPNVASWQRLLQVTLTSLSGARSRPDTPPVDVS